MDWQNEYKTKLVSVDDAVKHIKSGNKVVFGHAVGEPVALIDALVRNAAAYENVEILHMVAMGKSEYCKPEYAKNFRHNTIFLGATTRQAIGEGRGDYTPLFFYEYPDWFRTKARPDVALFQVSTPNEHGYCSFGVSVDYTKPAAECSKIKIAQVNKYMPYTYGDSFIHISDLDYIVEHDAPLIELKPPVLSDVEKAIGRNIASLVRNGDCLQLGIGAIPDAVLAGLGDKNDLGLHTEMFSDGAVDLLEKGVINNSNKNIHKGKSIAGFLMGTTKLYDFVNNNPSVEMYPIDYVNNPRIACQNDNLVSINACVQVDLMGQVVSDSIGYKQISGTGGQVDFVRAAHMSRGGRSIIAMPSITKGISKIVPVIDEGAAITTSRNDVGYVVTEHGIADLKGQTLRERARSLIAIAHPDFRAELISVFESRFRCKF
ncbi:MAG: 4-hydroxybutyrate CoA-transferase [Treponema sp.]|jgi:4-hydroxybutyrate CoA-transferase|nr:4-hydroxybutyrate CoA-transferase [Treponema sp.]